MHTLSFRLASPLVALSLLSLAPAVADRSNQVGTGQHQRGAGASLRREKELVLESLIFVRDEVELGADGVGERDEALDKLAHAIEELEESLEPALWLRDGEGNIEGSRLDPEEGAHVFNEERHTAQYTFDAIRNGEIENPDLREALLAIVDALVDIDRRLAGLALDDASAAGGDPEEIAEGLAELARGDALVKAAAARTNLRDKAALLYEAVDNAYRHAWEAAIDATEDGMEPITSAGHRTCGFGHCTALRGNRGGPTRP